MKTLKIDVPEGLLDAVGSDSEARDLMLRGAVDELLKAGRLTLEEAASILGECPGEWTHLADAGGAFDFWHDSAEDVYSEDDGEPV